MILTELPDYVLIEIGLNLSISDIMNFEQSAKRVYNLYQEHYWREKCLQKGFNPNQGNQLSYKKFFFDSKQKKIYNDVALIGQYYCIPKHINSGTSTKELKYVYNLFKDDRERDVLVRQIRWMLYAIELLTGKVVRFDRAGFSTDELRKICSSVEKLFNQKDEKEIQKILEKEPLKCLISDDPSEDVPKLLGACQII